MSEAIDRLATELSNLPAWEWTRLDALRKAAEAKEADAASLPATPDAQDLP